ncbi:hypothetical protein L5G32_16440 [Gordonia sp. HY002]|uniref:hypothetical protein n=1 Tax=Gordonia zhenghanii TaxID=2911516 RepID=UPI001EF001A7|nr:hypothetical protein [Gordonia zhenghanii]MCF8571859.1 hypothetical protein [Gordonia zhenghanii]MCF8604428.1 hypothetical protein [Gordonia zhenghanii]
MKIRRVSSILALTAAAAALLVARGTGDGVANAGPASCVPFGTAQLPPGAPASGSRAGLQDFPGYTGKAAPKRVDLRTETTQFNRHWDFALVGHRLIARPRGSAGSWRTVPLPTCLRNRLVAISLDDDGMRMTPSKPGLTATPRHLIGAVELDDATGSGPAVKAFVRDWIKGTSIAPITLSATSTDLVIR